MLKRYNALIHTGQVLSEWADVVIAADHEQVMKEKDDRISILVSDLCDEKNRYLAALALMKEKDGKIWGLEAVIIKQDEPIDEFTKNALDHCVYYENVADGEMLMLTTKLYEAVQIIKKQAAEITGLLQGQIEYQKRIAALTEELRLSGLRGDSLDRVVEEGVQKELALEVENSILREQNSDMNASLVKLRAEVERLLDAVKFAYRKHHLGDDFFGWEELSGILLTALCESMGDEGYQKWLAAFQQTEGDDK